MRTYPADLDRWRAVEMESSNRNTRPSFRRFTGQRSKHCQHPSGNNRSVAGNTWNGYNQNVEGILSINTHLSTIVEKSVYSSGFIFPLDGIRMLDIHEPSLTFK
ncbi:hypothetical protein MJO28_011052 [Puccinia striiformis f. sp. tritici]|uniref:Uncharacterized protein n=2 Tax=Puccinia striiformis f. sp. tritici TaxID=168172 RepID=A0ACC0E2M9_9BASI|nr:hypothetical protein MJO28_011052 [Puccinia striiformis f. sp. tritici]KAI7946283.1 hypothetical protein MJO29_010810 [Puccinia striiformis f. sp. tritici]